ncbi:MAG: dGTPase [Myxococcota bacterium]|jgi:dGTPase
MLYKFASFSQNSQGRLYEENDCQFRSIYGRDRDRIINSNSFRRLQYKTQVFVNHEGDHYRTRLTHSLEVAQIARWIASGLGCNKDLAEVVSLAHDLGHTPFGHAGEDALAAKMQDFGGFSHNSHTLKLITELEQSYLDFDGLNLSWEMLEGVVKHNGAIKDVSKVHSYIGHYNQKHDLDLKRSPSIEAQISAISDDIAYNNHDIEDGIRAELFRIEDLFDLPFIGDKFREILKQKPEARPELLVSEAKKRIVNDMVLDVIANTQNNIKELNINSIDDVRDCDFFLVQFSPEIEIAHQEIKKFLHKNMYRHYKVNRMTASAHKIVGGLFDFFIQNHNCLPAHHQISSNDKKELAINVSDYIAGMTDRFAISEYQKLLTT